MDQIIERLINDRPKFHCGIVETPNGMDPALSLLDEQRTRDALSDTPSDYGVGADALWFIRKTVSPGMRTLETGSGASTIAYAAMGAIHTAVTPSTDEAQRITEYAQSIGVDMSSVTFAHESSDTYLPKHNTPLDHVLIDGKHAFPWPFIDWFYTADRIVKDGWFILDDISMRSVQVLSDFLDQDDSWREWERFGVTYSRPKGKAVAYRKYNDLKLRDTSWIMQRWIFENNHKPKSLAQRVKRRLKRMVTR